MTFLLLIALIYYLVCVCVCGCVLGVGTHKPWYIWRTEDKLLESFLFPSYGSLGSNQIGHIYLLSHHSFFHIAFILLIFNEVYLGLPVHLFNILNTELLRWSLLKEGLRSLILMALVIL